MGQIFAEKIMSETANDYTIEEIERDRFHTSLWEGSCKIAERPYITLLPFAALWWNHGGDKALFYLLSLKISGIKNIKVPIELNLYKKTINNSDFDLEKYRIKAIYGENGSGKQQL